VINFAPINNVSAERRIWIQLGAYDRSALDPIPFYVSPGQNAGAAAAEVFASLATAQGWDATVVNGNQVRVTRITWTVDGEQRMRRLNAVTIFAGNIEPPANRPTVLSRSENVTVSAPNGPP
jgi:hypothetical protein